MTRLDNYTVIERATNEVIKEGTFCEVQEYLSEPEKYSVIWEWDGNEVQA